MSPDEYIRRRRALRELQRNPFYVETIAPALARFKTTMLDGLTKVESSPEKRSEFIQGYHEADSLVKLVEREKETLDSAETSFAPKDVPDDDDD